MVQSQSTTARKLFSLAWPIIGINVLNVLTLAVDTIMCGRLEDSDVALAALGYSTQLVFLLMVAMMGLTVGTVAMISRSFGARDPERVNHVMAQSTMLTVGLGVAIGIVGNLAAPYMLRGLGASDAAVAAGLDYLRPLLAGTTFYYLTILYGGVLRSVGNTRLPFMIALVANALNVFLNYGFINGNMGFPALGITGAAIGTVSAYLLSVVAMVTMLRRGVIADLFVSLRPTRLDRRLAGELFRVGVPAAFDMLVLNAAFLSIIGMLGRINETAVAAHGIGLRIQAIAFVPGLSVSQATGAMVGNALGARDPEQARRVVRAAMLLGTGIMTTLAIIIIVTAYPIVSLFDVASGSELEGYAVQWMRLLGYGMPIAGIHIALVGMLQGAGKTSTSLKINLWGTLAFQIPMSALLGFTFGLGALGVWLAFPLSYVIRATLSFGVYKRGKWATTGRHV